MAKMYVVTGKLGSGKTLYTVKKAQEYLQQNRRVVTNLDFNISVLLGKKSDSKKLLRIPDQPNEFTFDSIGQAYSGSYNENKTGAIILDECATWLNARDWNDKSRKGLLNKLVHIRKKGWDVYLIIQDISMLDKQVRKVIAEHTIICRRLDRMKIPLFGFLLSAIGLTNRLPKMHLASIFYGDYQGAPLVSTEAFLGKGLYNAYDTRQIFDASNNTSFCVLPPSYYKHLSFVKWNMAKIMRLTQIYLRRYSIVALVSLAAIFFCLITFFATSFYYDSKIESKFNAFKLENMSDISPVEASSPGDDSSPGQDQPKSFTDRFQIIGFMQFNKTSVYTLRDRFNDDYKITTEAFESMGYKIKSRGSCEALAVNKTSGSVERFTCL